MRIFKIYFRTILSSTLLGMLAVLAAGFPSPAYAEDTSVMYEPFETEQEEESTLYDAEETEPDAADPGTLFASLLADESNEIIPDGITLETEIPEEAFQTRAFLPGIDAIPDQAYTGAPITPEVFIYLDDELLQEGTDYTLEYADNTEIGTATVTAYGMGDYPGRSVCTFRILDGVFHFPEALPIPEVDYLTWYRMLEEKNRIQIGEYTELDYEILWPEEADAGEQAVTVSGLGFYAGQKKTYVIDVAPSDLRKQGKYLAMDLSGLEERTVHVQQEYNDWKDLGDLRSLPFVYTYTGEPIEPNVYFFYDWDYDEEGNYYIGPKYDWTPRVERDYSLAFLHNTEPGIATILLTGRGRYSGTITQQFRIVKPNRCHVTFVNDEPLEEYENAYWSEMFGNGADGELIEDSKGFKLIVHLPGINRYEGIFAENNRRCFLGWSVNRESYTPDDVIYVAKNQQEVTLYAIWGYQIRVNYDYSSLGKDLDGSIGDGNGIGTDYVLEGERILEDSFSYTGFHTKKIIDWNTSPDGTGISANQLIAADYLDGITFYAILSDEDRCIVTLDPNGGALSDPYLYVDKGKSISELSESDAMYNAVFLKEPSLTQQVSGMVFSGWSLDPEGRERIDITTYVVNRDITLYAVWNPRRTVTFHTDRNAFSLGGMYITRSAQERYATVGDGCNLSNILGEGKNEEEGFLSTKDQTHYLLGWRDESDGRIYTYEELRKLPIEEDKDFTAVWKQYELTLHANGQGKFFDGFTLSDQAGASTNRAFPLLVYTGPYNGTGPYARPEYALAGYSNIPDGEIVSPFLYGTEGYTELYAVWREACKVRWIYHHIGLFTSDELSVISLWVDEDGYISKYIGTGGTLPNVSIDSAIVGWSLTENGTPLTQEEYEKITVTEDITLYAVYKSRGNILSDEEVKNRLGITEQPANRNEDAGSGMQGNQSGEEAAKTTLPVPEQLQPAAIAAGYLPLQLKATKTGKTSIRLSWKSVSGAQSYRIYGAKHKETPVLLAQVFGTSYTAAKLAKNTWYRYYVEAVTDSAIIARSQTVYAATRGKYGNYKSLAPSAKKLTLKVGKSRKIKVKVKKQGGKWKKLQAVSYVSDKPSVAVVSASGKVRAVGKGTCTVYAYAQNGVSAKIKVRVE